MIDSDNSGLYSVRRFLSGRVAPFHVGPVVSGFGKPVQKPFGSL